MSSELEIVVSEWRSVTAVSLNVGGGVRLIKPAKLCMCTQNTTNTTRTDTRRRVCAAMVPLPIGQVSSTWKEANVSPVHKKDDPSVVSNYRPISLLNTICKAMEKIVHKHVFNFCRDNSILTALQSGFVPGDPL